MPRSDPMTPHPSRLSPQHPRYRQIVAEHERAMDVGEAMYSDPDTGLFVLTAQYHLDRGRCCGSGCRHCPYVGEE